MKKPIQYNTLNDENLNLIKEKAKSKKDGVYQLRGIAYRVKDSRITHLATNGNVCLYEMGFLVQAGSYEYEYAMNNHMKVLREVSE